MRPPALWTLTHEMAFYALFLLAFIHRWLFIAALLAWGVAGYVLTMVPGLSEARAAIPLVGSAYAFLFSLGVLAFFIVRACVIAIALIVGSGVVLGILSITSSSGRCCAGSMPGWMHGHNGPRRR